MRPPLDREQLEIAIAMADYLDISLLLRTRADLSAFAKIQLELLGAAAADQFWTWREGLQEAAGGDPAAWGPAYDRMRSLASEIRGRGAWVPGTHGAPHGAALH